MAQDGRSFGVEMRRLFDDLSRLSGGARCPVDIDRVRVAKREIDNRRGLLRSVGLRRGEAEEERRWVESDIRGFERALVLVGRSGVGVSDAADGECGARLRDKLDSRIERLVDLDAEIDALDERAGRLLAEIEELEAEVLGTLRQAVETAKSAQRAAATRRARTLKSRFGEFDPVTMWSPTPVYGYRMWRLDYTGFHGARKLWRKPWMAATCRRGDGVPHTDGRCAGVAYGCGIYAAKSVGVLMDEIGGALGDSFAVGLVALEGKVVEHERGYRAETAAVRVLIVAERGSLRMVDVDVALHDVFEDPLMIRAVDSTVLQKPASGEATRTTIERVLEERAERLKAWTLGSNNESSW